MEKERSQPWLLNPRLWLTDWHGPCHGICCSRPQAVFWKASRPTGPRGTRLVWMYRHKINRCSNSSWSSRRPISFFQRDASPKYNNIRTKPRNAECETALVSSGSRVQLTIGDCGPCAVCGEHHFHNHRVVVWWPVWCLSRTPSICVFFSRNERGSSCNVSISTICWHPSNTARFDCRQGRVSPAASWGWATTYVARLFVSVWETARQGGKADRLPMVPLG